MDSSLASQSSDWSSLVESARQGNDEAFGQICDRMGDYLLLTTRSFGNSLPAKFGVSDIVQQTWMEARRDIASFQGDSERDLQVWLVQLVRNNLIDSVRRYRDTDKRDVAREAPKSMDGLGEEFLGLGKTASSIFCHQETDREMLRALAVLPEKWRRVVELRLWQEVSYTEISHQLGISTVAARKMMQRALETLKKKLSIPHVDRSAKPR